LAEKRGYAVSVHQKVELSVPAANIQELLKTTRAGNIGRRLWNSSYSRQRTRKICWQDLWVTIHAPGGSIGGSRRTSARTRARRMVASRHAELMVATLAEL